MALSLYPLLHLLFLSLLCSHALINRESEKLNSPVDVQGGTVKHPWERVVGYLDLSAVPASTATTAASTDTKKTMVKKDTSRMRSILLTLKNDGLSGMA
jgi:hypothetical protein